jgi:hypothetical protein
METLDSEAALELRKKYSFLTGEETTSKSCIVYGALFIVN